MRGQGGHGGRGDHPPGGRGGEANEDEDQGSRLLGKLLLIWTETR